MLTIATSHVGMDVGKGMGHMLHNHIVSRLLVFTVLLVVVVFRGGRRGPDTVMPGLPISGNFRWVKGGIQIVLVDVVILESSFRGISSSSYA